MRPTYITISLIGKFTSDVNFAKTKIISISNEGGLSVLFGIKLVS